MTVLAGRLPAAGATGQIVLTPRIAGFFGVGVGGRVTYLFSNTGRTRDRSARRPVRRTFRVTAIVDVPPVLVDQSDQIECRGPAARRHPAGCWRTTSTPGSGCAWTAAPPAYRRCSTSLAGAGRAAATADLRGDSPEGSPDLTFNIRTAGHHPRPGAAGDQAAGRSRWRSSARSPRWPCWCSSARAWRSC